MTKDYIKPEMDIMVFETEDVITTSGGNGECIFDYSGDNSENMCASNVN